MANLIGSVTSDRSHVHRISSRSIEARLETWHGAIAITLGKDGDYEVRVGTKYGIGRTIASGNVNDEARKELAP